MTVEPRSVTAFIGPSGCGKSTFLRTLNRMHEVIPGGRVEGKVMLDDQDLYAPGVDPVAVRRTVGMVFQRPNPFPTMSIYDNVAAGLQAQRRQEQEDARRASSRGRCTGANLWNEVKDRLNKPGAGLSGGQQQRLCIARAIAVEPQVLLMDEPCSALDPISTLAIEDLISELKRRYTIVIVTHNMQQAARVSDRTAFFNLAATGKPGRLDRDRRHRRRSSPTRPRRPPRTTSPAASADPSAARPRLPYARPLLLLSADFVSAQPVPGPLAGVMSGSPYTRSRSTGGLPGAPASTASRPERPVIRPPATLRRCADHRCSTPCRPCSPGSRRWLR